MRKIIIALLLISINSFAQNKFGAFTGVNYSYFTDGFGQVLAEESFGLQLGVVYEKQLSPKVAFRPKLIFSQQGDRTRTPMNVDFDPVVYENFEVDNLDKKLTYINIPIDFKFWNKIYLIAGPQIGFLVNEKSFGDYPKKAKSDIDFGVNLGTGFTINKMFFEVGIYQGLTSIYEYRYFFTGNNVSAQNGFAKFTVGYMFN